MKERKKQMTEQKKTHWKKVFNSDYLSSADINGEDLVAVIQSVRIEKVDGARGAQECNVAHFTDKKIKPMILNVTNSKMVKKFANSKFIEDWNNIPVQIYADDNVKAFGEITEALRIRSQQPRIGKPELKPNTEQWTKAVAFLKGGGKIEQISLKYSFTKETSQKLLEESLPETNQ